MFPELVEPRADFIYSGCYTHDLRGRRGWSPVKVGRHVLIEHNVSTENERRHGSYHNEWLRPWDLPWWAAVGFPSGDSLYDKVHYNGKKVGPAGYREILESDSRAIPDLYFNIELLLSDPPRIASRLHFDCTPTGILFGLPVNGKRVQC